MASEAPDKVLFIDVRTRGELQFIGMPTLIDAHVPFLVETTPPQWDEANSTFKLAPNPTFVDDVGRRLAQKGLGRARSGDRDLPGWRARRPCGQRADAGRLHDGLHDSRRVRG